MELPEKLTSYVPSRWGRDGSAWLDALADVVTSLQRDWQLGPFRVAADSNRSFVAATERAGRPAWLKVECDPEWQAAADTLRAWSGHGISPEIIARCDRRRATLIADAGSPLTGVSVATSKEVGRILDTAHRLPAVPTVRARRGAGAASADVALARIDALAHPPFERSLLLRPLPDSTRAPVARHGDLTARNVCRASDGRVALIDPDPRTGPPELDTVQWALRVEDGQRWREHLTAVTRGRFDERLASALVPHMTRTYVAYLLATGRPVSDIHLELAQRDRVEI